MCQEAKISSSSTGGLLWAFEQGVHFPFCATNPDARETSLEEEKFCVAITLLNGTGEREKIETGDRTGEDSMLLQHIKIQPLAQQAGQRRGAGTIYMAEASQKLFSHSLPLLLEGANRTIQYTSPILLEGEEERDGRGIR